MHSSDKIQAQDGPATEYFHHARAPRVNTDIVIKQALEAQYPNSHITVTPEMSCPLLRYAGAGHARSFPLIDPDQSVSTSLTWRQYLPPARRLDGETGALVDIVLFGKFLYSWKNHEFFLYVVDGRDGSDAYPVVRNNYLVGDQGAANELLFAVGKFTTELRDEIWVFDRGYWQKDRTLWQSVQKASWSDVILDQEMKDAIIEDHERFFDSRFEYARLKVPWKRGLIFWGPPGNGKTISIKAMMHTLYGRKVMVPTLYVKTLSSFNPPEYSLGSIFSKARQQAPCYLVFEDLDSIVSDRVRSFFLNEVDGLQPNDGILMLGSTNHLERLDPGISKRPSRFDRKYFFPDPDFDQRVKYCEFWQGKLADNDDIEFPHKLCSAIAKITDGFSFAYIQEAFVAALLSIAYNRGDKNKGKQPKFWEFDPSIPITMTTNDSPADDLDDFILWREIKKEIKILREELGQKPEVNAQRTPYQTTGSRQEIAPSNTATATAGKLPVAQINPTYRVHQPLTSFQRDPFRQAYRQADQGKDSHQPVEPVNSTTNPPHFISTAEPNQTLPDNEATKLVEIWNRLVVENDTDAAAATTKFIETEPRQFYARSHEHGAMQEHHDLLDPINDRSQQSEQSRTVSGFPIDELESWYEEGKKF